MNLTLSEQAVYDSGYARGLAFGPFDPPGDLSDTDHIVWRCGLYAGLAEALRRKREQWEAGWGEVHLVPPSKPPSEQAGPPPVTDADRDEVVEAAAVWDKLSLDDEPLDARDD
jgi:hypothetical protein